MQACEAQQTECVEYLLDEIMKARKKCLGDSFHGPSSAEQQQMAQLNNPDGVVGGHSELKFQKKSIFKSTKSIFFWHFQKYIISFFWHFQKYNNTFFTLSKMAKYPFLHQKKV